MNATAGRPPAAANTPEEPGQAQAARPVNPYRCSAAIRDPSDFYGRTSELRRVFDALRKWECINVVGERRSGKTSFLLHIAHPEVQRRYAQDNADALFVYLDAEVLPQEPCEFFRAFIARARANWPELACTVDEHNLQSETCERQVLQFLQEMLPRRLVLLVDEFEGITQCPAFPLRFFEFLRGLSQAYNISYVVATRQNLKQSCSQENIISPFFNIFRPVTMGPFSPDEFDCFLSETAFRCSLPIYRAREQILRLAGYQPYLDQMACSCYFDAYVDRHDPNYLAALERRFREEAEPYFDSVWNTYLSAEERRALQLLAHGAYSARCQQPEPAGESRASLRRAYRLRALCRVHPAARHPARVARPTAVALERERLDATGHRGGRKDGAGLSRWPGARSALAGEPVPPARVALSQPRQDLR